MVREAGVKSIVAFHSWRAGLPKNKKLKMPQRPEKFYKGQYSFEDFFGGKYLSLSELSKKVRKAGLRSREDYRKHRQSLPKEERVRWPYCPGRAFANFSPRSFFGVQTWELNGFHPIGVLIKKVRTAGIVSIKSYMRYRSRIDDSAEKARWPQRPDWAYSDFNYSTFFGVRSPDKRFYSYQVLKAKVHNFKIRGREEYRAFRQRLTDKAERRRWPSVPRDVYRGFSRDDFFYREAKRWMSFSEAVAFLESKKAVYACDYRRLRAEEPLLPPKPKTAWKHEFNGSDSLFRFRTSGPLIKVANLYYYDLKEFCRFLRTNAIIGQKQYLKVKRALPAEERKFYPQRPKEIYLRFYGEKDGVGPETNFYRLWSEFASAAEMSRAVRALGLKDCQELQSAAGEIPALAKDPTSFGDWPGKLLGYGEDEAWGIFFGTYDVSSEYFPEDQREGRDEAEPEIPDVALDDEVTDEDISRMLASVGESVLSFDD